MLTMAAMRFLGGRIVRFDNVLRPGECANGIFDACFAPRNIVMTEQLRSHDMGIDAHGMPLSVNTRLNRLGTVDLRYSSRPLQRPPFIGSIVDEDRCHLNAMAMRDRRSGWVIVVDVAADRIIFGRQPMPRSSPLYCGMPYLLNAGAGDSGRSNSLTKSIR